MNCWKCGKKIDREDGGTTCKGIVVRVDLCLTNPTEADIKYFNEQLGKYSDGSGGCEIVSCYECHIDRLLCCGVNELL